MFKKKGLKITALIMLGIFLMLFLAFIFTFDLSYEKKYIEQAESEEVRDELNGLLSRNIEDSKVIKVLDITFENEIINDILRLYKDSISNNIENYEVRGIEFDTFNGNFLIKFHMTYTKHIRYKFVVQLTLKMSEDSSKYTFTLINSRFGALTIPRRLIVRELKNENKGSVGWITNQILYNLGFGSYNENNLELYISKPSICESLRSGLIGETMYEDDYVTRTSSSIFLSSFFNNNLINIEIDEGVHLKINYAKMLNTKHERSEELNKLIEESGGFEAYYNLLFKYLVNGQNLTLDDDILSALIHYNINDKFVESINDEDENFIIRTMLTDIYSSYKDKVLMLNFVYNLGSKDLILKVKFDYVNELFSLSEARIGYDDKDDTDSFVEIAKTSNLQYLIDFLVYLGFDGDVINQTLNRASLFNKPSYVSEVSYESNADLVVKGHDYTEKIRNTLLSDEFYSSLTSEIKEILDNSSIESVLETYERLSYQDKYTLLVSLKNYFKENEFYVYNYMDDLMEDLTKWFQILLRQ